MSCTTNITYQEFRDRAIDSQMIFPVSKNTTVEDSVGYLKATQEYTRINDGEYFLAQDDIKLTDKEKNQRVSQIRNNIYKKFKQGDKYLGDSNIQSEGGTFVHELLYIANTILADAYTNSTSWEAAKGKARSEMKKNKDFKITEPLIDNILAVSENILREMIDTQNKIDSTKKVEFFFENRVLDPTSNKYKMGTLDVLGVYSDKTYSHYDYKTLTPPFNRKKRKSFRGSMVDTFSKEPIEGIKFEGYRLPMNRYREILGKNYGLTKARHVKLIPIVTNYKWNGTEYDREITYVTSEFTADSQEEKELLSSVSTSFQTTGNEKLDSTIKKLQSLIEKWEKQRSEYPKVSPEYDKLTFKIKRLRKSINSIYNNSDLDTYFLELKKLFNFIYKDNKDVFNLEFNEEGAFTADELRELNIEVDIYLHSITESVLDRIEVLKKDDPESYEKHIKNYEHFVGQLSGLKYKIETAILKYGNNTIKEQGINTTESGDFSFLPRWFTRLSDFDNPVFKTASSLIQEGIFRKNAKVNEFTSKLDTIMKNAKKAGFSYEALNNEVINKNTGNLVTPMKSSFYEDKSPEFKVKYYKPKDNWESIYEDNYKIHEKIIRDSLSEQKGILTDAEIEEQFQKKMLFWESQNKLYREGAVNEQAWTNKYSWLYLEINKEAAQKDGFVNEQYTKIQNNPALKAYYDFITEHNKMFREILGVEWEQVSDYFLPWVRKSVADVAFDKFISSSDKMKLLSKDLGDSFVMAQDDMFNGERDADGKPLMTIPKWFIAPLRDNDGKVDVNMKSFDIGKTMVLFADMAYNYEAMSGIEGKINILKEMLLIESQTIQQNGKPVLGKFMQELEKKLNKGDNVYETFENLTNSFLYGIQISDEDKIINIGDKQISLIKTLYGANNYYVSKSIGLDPRVALASFLGPKTLMYSHAVKGTAFNKKMLMSSQKMLAKYTGNKVFKAYEEEAKQVIFLMEFFQTSTERNVELDARKFSQSFANKHLNSDLLFKWMRDGEKAIDTHLTLAMSMMYGFDKNGNFGKIYNPDNTVRANREGFTSIFDLLKQKGPSAFEGMDVKSLMKFRQAVMEESKKLKGSMTYDDKALFQTQILGRLLMTFKTWMPGVIGDRFGKLKYNEKLDSVDWGRYSSIIGSNAYMADDTLNGFLKEVVLPSLTKFITETATFGLVYKSDKWKPLNEKRLKRIYEKERNQNPDKFTRLVNGKEEVVITFEDFKTIILQNQKATQAELRAVLGLMLLMWAASAVHGDDDEPIYKNSWAGRTTYRLMSRLYTELAFLYSPDEYLKLLGSSIPLLGLVKDVKNFAKNTLDESRDMIFGENSKRDQANNFYHAVKMTKGLNALSKLVELFPSDKNKTR